MITTDPVTERMPGPAIRAWHLSEVLSSRHEVTLVSTVAADRHHPDMDVRMSDGEDLDRLAEAADVVVGPGSVVRRHPVIARSEIPLVVDLYDPYHLENLEPDGVASLAERNSNVGHLNAVVREDLLRGDFFLCASARQRDFWLGSLAAMGRVNSFTYAQDPMLRRLVDVVPFGLPTVPPVRRGPGLRGHMAGIGPDDRVVVWGGGIYNWFDPVSLVRAVDHVRRQVPTLRLVFLGMRNPNPHIPEMRAATETRALSDQLGLTGTHVFFKEGWVPYDDRADFLLDADLGVSTHLDHIETRFSFRTRVLDYLWAGLPMLLTDGDALAELVAGGGAGTVVPAGDVTAIADGLVHLLDDPPSRDVVRAVAEGFRWPDVAGPLVEFCQDPGRAADRASGSGTHPSLVSSPAPMDETFASTRPCRAAPRAESQLGVDDAGYLAQIRGAVSRLGSGPAAGGVAGALTDLEDVASIDVEVPVTSSRRAGRLVKQAIKRLTRWYLRYVAQQTTVLGQATVRLGVAVAQQADRLEDTTSGLAHDMAGLRARIERLERQSTDGRGVDGGEGLQ